MTADITFHYPPDLFNLLVDAIPLLNKTKKDLLLFFKGAGVADDMLRDLQQRLKVDPKNIGKFEIARTVLQRLNERGEGTLREAPGGAAACRRVHELRRLLARRPAQGEGPSRQRQGHRQPERLLHTHEPGAGGGNDRPASPLSRRRSAQSRSGPPRSTPPGRSSMPCLERP